jgi:hypothetical protein
MAQARTVHRGGCCVGEILMARYVFVLRHSSFAVLQERRLISYGPDLVEQYRQAAGYIDCEKPANLPVHPSTKFELVINLKTPLRHSSSKCR